MATFLEITNMAIRESGTDLDEIASADFANPPDPLHYRFKNWVIQAWKEIQLERNWLFTTSQNLVSMSTGALRTDYDGGGIGLVTVAAVNNRYLKGITSGTIAQVNSYAPLPSAADFANFGGQGTALMYVKNADGLFTLGEEINIYDVAATPTTVADDTAVIATTFVYRGLPSYNYADVKVYPGTIDTDEVYLQQALTASGTNGVLLTERKRLKYAEYIDFRPMLPTNIEAYVYDTPEYFTYSPDGLLEFYPLVPYTTEFYGAAASSQTPWRLELNSRRTTQVLSAFGDIPSRLPAEYHDMIAWRAVMEYSNYDEKPSKWRTAKGRYNFYKHRVEEKLIEQPRWQPNPYYPRLGGRR